jgi:hypothetical protein
MFQSISGLLDRLTGFHPVISEVCLIINSVSIQLDELSLVILKELLRSTQQARTIQETTFPHEPTSTSAPGG